MYLHFQCFLIFNWRFLFFFFFVFGSFDNGGPLVLSDSSSSLATNTYLSDFPFHVPFFFRPFFRFVCFGFCSSSHSLSDIFLNETGSSSLQVFCSCKSQMSSVNERHVCHCAAVSGIFPVSSNNQRSGQSFISSLMDRQSSLLQRKIIIKLASQDAVHNTESTFDDLFNASETLSPSIFLRLGGTLFEHYIITFGSQDDSIYVRRGVMPRQRAMKKSTARLCQMT